MKKLDARRLASIIHNVESSLEAQELSLAPEQKAKLIASLYGLAHQQGRVPDKMTTDRMVWLA